MHTYTQKIMDSYCSQGGSPAQRMCSEIADAREAMLSIARATTVEQARDAAISYLGVYDPRMLAQIKPRRIK
jgi:hypothetical protein